jgi:hypothetical protein
MSSVIYSILALIGVGIIYLLWCNRRRRPHAEGFQYVYVNQDGSARELTESEREYLDTDFEGGDGGRPYVKFRYESKDGWGSISGFIQRRQVPAKIPIASLIQDPLQDDVVSMDVVISDAEAVGDVIERGEDGSTTIIPNPTLNIKERFRILTERQLSLQRSREEAIMKISTMKPNQNAEQCAAGQSQTTPPAK